MTHFLRLAASVALILFLVPRGIAAPAPAARYLTADEALELTFPEAEVERRTAYLTKEQVKAAEKLAGFELDSSMYWIYTAMRKGEVVGFAYFDTHKVRTKKETLMIALTPEQRIRRIEILAFAEPTDYIPSGNWYAEFVGQVLSEDLRVKGEIPQVTGATLTTRATTKAVREHLAVHQALYGPPPPEPEPGP